MFGHTLRMKEDTPARKAMQYYFQPEPQAKKFLGGRRTTIVTNLNRDIRKTKDKFPQFDLTEMTTELNLRNMRGKARDRILWNRRVKMISDTVYSDRAVRYNISLL